MLVCVVGTSTSFTYWAFSIASHALAEVAGDVHRIHCTSASEMHEQWERRAGRPALFTTDFLEENVSRLIIDSSAPIIALIDTAELAIATAAKLRKLSFLWAVRHTSLYISSFAEILAHPACTVFGAETRNTTVFDFVSLLIGAMGLPNSVMLTKRVMEKIYPDESLWDSVTVNQAIGETQNPIALENVFLEWSERDINAFHTVAASYQQILDQKPENLIIWPSALLHSANAGFTTKEPLELVGPARLLVWGPYMHLPKGNWTAIMEFEASNNFSPNSVRADVLLGGQFAELAEFDLPLRGIYTWSLKFHVDDFSKAVEVRLTLSRSAIEGTLFLREVRLFRQSADPIVHPSIS